MPKINGVLFIGLPVPSRNVTFRYGISPKYFTSSDEIIVERTVIVVLLNEFSFGCGAR